MPLATRLIFGDDRFVGANWGHVAERFAETALAEFFGAAKKLDRMAGTLRRQAKFHGPMMFVAQRQNVRPHGEESSTATPGLFTAR